MRCATSCSGSKDRCVLTSIMMLGALFALSTSPCARVPPVSALVIIGVPLMTFAVAAPSRIGLIRELALFMRGLEATLLQVLLFAVGRRRDAYRARDVFRARVENAYAAGSDRLADAVRDDPLRLHHARRLASLATLLALVAVMVDRRRNKVKRMLSGIGDYFAWAITFLPVLSGYLAFHHLVLDYTLMLAIHILSVELLLIALPFTKLTHVVTLFLARWYNGDWFGRRGVAS